LNIFIALRSLRFFVVEVCLNLAGLGLVLLSCLSTPGLFTAEAQRNAEVARRGPVIYWSESIETAQRLKQAGVEQIAVRPDNAEAWRKAGFKVIPITQPELERREKLPVPRIAGRANVASATRRPWIDSNGWRFVRHQSGRFFYDLPAGKAALAAAEAFAYKADAILKIDQKDLAEVGNIFAFFRSLPDENYPLLADIGVIDDGSPAMGEVMNLLTRRNLLFKPVSAPSSQLRLNLKLGTPEYPEAETADPSAFALKIRRQLGDDNRTLRVYGSETVICRLTGDGSNARLHLLNYTGANIEGLRIRLRGVFREVKINLFGLDQTPLEDLSMADGATEFSIPKMKTYAVVELK
jgi:hypothetical protein